MTSDPLIELLDRAIPESRGTVGYVPSRLPGLGVVRQVSSTPIEATVYEPVLCLILRGRKRTFAGAVSVDFGPGESLIVSHDLPVVSQVTECPYLALILSLDIGILRSVGEQIEEHSLQPGGASALAVGAADERLIEALGRYVSLSHDPVEARILGPLVLKEILFRLFNAPHGGMLRNLLHADSTASQIHRAVGVIRRNFRAGVSVPDLARRSGMSESAFYRSFKAITGTTPLRYLKAMRLLEARRLLLTEGYGVTEAALAVGYASPTQFSREYSREFSVPPKVHANGAAAAAGRTSMERMTTA
ncbi:MAG: AraC family transcriptional regulator N-terminal domain-containing protein [Vicinamibacterales bacterium]